MTVDSVVVTPEIDQRALGIGRAVDLPIGLQLDQQLAVEHAGDVGVLGHVDAPDLAVVVAVVVPGEEVWHAHDHVVEIVAVPEAHAGHGHVGLLALEHQLGLGRLLAALPQAHGARVAGIGHFVVGKRRAVEHAVAIAPGDAALGLRDVEAIGDELAGLEVELAAHRRVGAAHGQPDHAAVVVGVAAAGAGPDPVLVLLGGQRVDVEEDVPVRLVAAVLVQRGLAPDAAHVLGVAPEVVDLAAAQRRVGDAIVGGQDLQRAFVDRLEHRLRLQLGQRDLVLAARPGQRVRAFDFLQPAVGIAVVCHGHSRSGQRRRHQYGCKSVHRWFFQEVKSAGTHCARFRGRDAYAIGRTRHPAPSSHRLPR
jgi:hypothetical protein